MRRLAPLGAPAILALGLALVAGATPRPSAPRGFGAAPLWDDGRAETSFYVGTTLAGGEPRPTEARLIVRKEDLLIESLVKSDEGPLPGRTFEALTAHQLVDVALGDETVHEMASVFLDRATLTPRKETTSHIDSRGLTFVRVGPKRGKLVHEAHSYRDGEADRERPVKWPGNDRPHLWADALPVTLRGWAAAGNVTAAQDVYLLPSQMGGRSPAGAAQASATTIAAGDGGEIVVPAGRFASRRFVVERGRASDTLWFDRAWPHVLLRLQTAEGRRLELTKTSRTDGDTPARTTER